MKKRTKKIAGQTITLSQGWYIATSPIGTYEVNIKNDHDDIVWHKDFGQYELRCEFLNAFNNGEMSFDGREWV